MVASFLRFKRFIYLSTIDITLTICYFFIRMIKESLNPKSIAVFNFIKKYIMKNGHSPTFSEMESGLSTDRSTLARSVNKLVRMGYLTKIPRAHYGLLIKKDIVFGANNS